MTTAMKLQPAYSYIRFSKGLQAKGDSFRRQFEATRDYCAKHRMILDDKLTFRDLGVTAYTGKNLTDGALGRFLSACENGIVKPGSALVVESLDRLSRQSPWIAIELMNSLISRYKIDVHVTSRNKVFLSDSPNQANDLIECVLLLSRANEESASKSKRLLEVWAQKRKRAEEKHEFMRSDLPWWLVAKGGRIISPPDRKTTVIEIFKLTAAGHSSAQVARLLNAKKRPTWQKKQKHWTSARVRGLVQSSSPQGILQATPKTVAAGRRYKIAGYYPVVVGKSLAAQARLVLKNNSTGNRGRPAKHRRPTNPFRGLLRYNGHWTRHATHRNGTKDPKTRIKGWNSYYECFDEKKVGTKGEMLFCISGRQLEPVVFAGLSELKPADLAPPEPDSAVHMVALLEKEIVALEKQNRNLVRTIAATGSVSLSKQLLVVEKALDDKRLEHERAERQGEPKAVETGEFKAIVGNLHHPEVRKQAAVALRRIVKRIDIARTFDDLPISDDFRRRFVRQRNAIIAKATLIKDPVPKNRRRKPLHVMVTFSTGVSRYIGRLDGAKDQLVSWRVEASKTIQ